MSSPAGPAPCTPDESVSPVARLPGFREPCSGSHLAPGRPRRTGPRCGRVVSAGWWRVSGAQLERPRVGGSLEREESRSECDDTGSGAER
jgi:hypothetical protein